MPQWEQQPPATALAGDSSGQQQQPQQQPVPASGLHAPSPFSLFAGHPAPGATAPANGHSALPASVPAALLLQAAHEPSPSSPADAAAARWQQQRELAPPAAAAVDIPLGHGLAPSANPYGASRPTPVPDAGFQGAAAPAAAPEPMDAEGGEGDDEDQDFGWGRVLAEAALASAAGGAAQAVPHAYEPRIAAAGEGPPGPALPFPGLLVGGQREGLAPVFGETAGQDRETGRARPPGAMRLPRAQSPLMDVLFTSSIRADSACGLPFLFLRLRNSGVEVVRAAAAAAVAATHSCCRAPLGEDHKLPRSVCWGFVEVVAGSYVRRDAATSCKGGGEPPPQQHREEVVNPHDGCSCCYCSSHHDQPASAHD